MTPMNDQNNGSGGSQPGGGKPPGFGGFFTFRVVAGVVLGVVALWAVWVVLGLFEGRKPDSSGHVELATLSHDDKERHDAAFDPGHESEDMGGHGSVGHEAVHGKDTEHAISPGHSVLPEHGEAESGHGDVELGHRASAKPKLPESDHDIGTNLGLSSYPWVGGLIYLGNWPSLTNNHPLNNTEIVSISLTEKTTILGTDVDAVKISYDDGFQKTELCYEHSTGVLISANTTIGSFHLELKLKGASIPLPTASQGASLPAATVLLMGAIVVIPLKRIEKQ